MATHSFEGVWSGNKAGIFGLLAWGCSIAWLAHLLEFHREDGLDIPLYSYPSTAVEHLTWTHLC